MNALKVTLNSNNSIFPFDGSPIDVRSRRLKKIVLSNIDNKKGVPVMINITGDNPIGRVLPNEINVEIIIDRSWRTLLFMTPAISVDAEVTFQYEEFS